MKKLFLFILLATTLNLFAHCYYFVKLVDSKGLQHFYQCVRNTREMLKSDCFAPISSEITLFSDFF